MLGGGGGVGGVGLVAKYWNDISYLEEAFAIERRRVEDGHVSIAKLIVVQQKMASAVLLMLLLLTFDPLMATDCQFKNKQIKIKTEFKHVTRRANQTDKTSQH